jgi:hypothetical protein
MPRTPLGTGTRGARWLRCGLRARCAPRPLSHPSWPLSPSPAGAPGSTVPCAPRRSTRCPGRSGEGAAPAQGDRRSAPGLGRACVRGLGPPREHPKQIDHGGSNERFRRRGGCETAHPSGGHSNGGPAHRTDARPIARPDDVNVMRGGRLDPLTSRSSSERQGGTTMGTPSNDDTTAAHCE